MGITKTPLTMQIQTLFLSHWRKHTTHKAKQKTRINNVISESSLLEDSRGFSNGNKPRIPIRGEFFLS